MAKKLGHHKSSGSTAELGGSIAPDAPLALAPHKLTRGELQILFDLYRKQPWLAGREDAVFDLWDLCSSKQEQSLVWDLLYRFTFLSGKHLGEALEAIHIQVTKNWM